MKKQKWIKKNKKYIAITIIVVLAIIFYYNNNIYEQRIQQCCNEIDNLVNSQPGGYGKIGMANPASVFCKCLGGTFSIKETPAGQEGMCRIFLIEYDEWKYFNEKCSNNKYS